MPHKLGDLLLITSYGKCKFVDGQERSLRIDFFLLKVVDQHVHSRMNYCLLKKCSMSVVNMLLSRKCKGGPKIKVQHASFGRM